MSQRPCHMLLSLCDNAWKISLSICRKNVPLAGFCLTRYSLHVLKMNVDMIKQTNKQANKQKPMCVEPITVAYYSWISSGYLTTSDAINFLLASSVDHSTTVIYLVRTNHVKLPNSSCRGRWGDRNATSETISTRENNPIVLIPAEGFGSTTSHSLSGRLHTYVSTPP